LRSHAQGLEQDREAASVVGADVGVLNAADYPAAFPQESAKLAQVKDLKAEANK
jgi:hypothetical protein